MAVETVVARRQKIKLIAVAIVCLVLALWGAYENFVAFPRIEKEFAHFTALKAEFQALEAKDKQGTITQAEREQWKRVDTELSAFSGEPPQPPDAWDRPVNTWLYIVACGVLGVPWCLWSLWSMSRRRWRLEDDGTLHSPDGTFARDEIAEIDMSRWMDKSIATVKAGGDRSTLLDDYKYKNSDLIVGRIAHRLSPDEWTEEAKQVKRPSDESGSDSEVGPDVSASASGA